MDKTEKLLADLDFMESLPKWVPKFRETFYKEDRLPFLLLYYAVGISKNPALKTSNKSAAIAIATANLQDQGYLLEGTNALSLSGELREISTMSRLGKRRTEEYIQRFEDL